MSELLYPIARIGIIGGGQLGRMLVRKAHQLGCSVTILDPTPGSPAGQMADRQLVGNYFDEALIRELVETSEVTTFDLENIDAAILSRLAAEGNRILPDPHLLAIIQDKVLQKEKLRQFGLPTSPFLAVDVPDRETFSAFGYPLVQKARRGGYDGRGVAVLRSESDWEKHLPVPGLIEQYIPFVKELAVLVARSTSGETSVYPVTEMVFIGEANVMDMLVAPADISPELAHKAQQLAVETIQAFDGVGVFGVELFLTAQEDVLINEISPRTHNSGHYTIEACITDQFEQHLRAILGFPLGDAGQMIPAALINLLGAPGYTGRPIIRGMREALAIPGVSIHLYGKAKTSPYRKMGHVTIVDQDIEEARKKAIRVKNLLSIIAAP